MVERLSDYPWIIVRVSCSLCQRSGSYKLARLSAKFGSEASLEEVMDGLAADCPWRRLPGERRAGKYDAKCAAVFVDLITHQPPPDLPPALRRLRLVRGGRSD